MSLQSCQQVDLKAYAMGEASAAERKAVEGHAVACDACRIELDSLGTLQAAMMTWADEEPPRRIAFVSDKVFEPSAWQRFVASFNPATLLASIALSGLIAFGVGRIAQTASIPVQSDVTTVVAADTVDLATRVDNAVKAALAENDRRHKEETTQLIRATEQRMRRENDEAFQQTMAIMESNFERLRKREARMIRASADTVNFQ